jgi:pimeloyl-ACP methyl ester carboxylesterase
MQAILANCLKSLEIFSNNFPKKINTMPLYSRIAATILFVLFCLSGCASTSQKIATYAINAERERSDLLRKEIDLPNGLHYVYLEGGRGEPLLLVHGFGGNKDNFTRVARLLTPHYRIIVPDQIGFGESAHPQDADYTPAAQADRLRSLMQALGIKTVHLGGNSMGGAIALSYAAQYPNEVASLWLLDTAGIWSAPKSELAQIIGKEGRNPLLVKNEDDFAHIFNFAMSERPYIPRFLLDVMAQERIQNFALEQRIFEQITSASLEKQIAGLMTPTLIVWGEQDRLIHVGTAEVLHKLMPRSQVIIMPHIGHVPMIEQPKLSAEDYLRFRASLSGH